MHHMVKIKGRGFVPFHEVSRLSNTHTRSSRSSQESHRQNTCSSIIGVRASVETRRREAGQSVRKRCDEVFAA